MLKTSAAVLLVIALLAPFSTRLDAQEAPAKHFRMEKIAFKGTRVFTDEQLLHALGMNIGADYTQQNLVDAASKLANSGVFSKVSYRLTSNSAEFFLVDNTSLLPVRFENCVWMSEQQMIAKLKQRVPFFTGKVPEQGALTEDIARQVEAVLAETGVTAKLQYTPSFEDGSATAVTYAVIDPRIEISAIRFAGASPELSKDLDAATKSVLGKEYTPAFVTDVLRDKLKPIMGEHGYISGSFGQPSLKLVSASGDQIARIELTVPVVEGAQYRVAALTVKGTDPIALDALKRLSTFKTGEIANMKVLRGELSKLGGAYLAAGHMNAKVKADPTFDDTNRTVSFEIEMLPGDVYKLSKLDIQGLDESRKAKFLPIWKLNPGDVYDPTYAPSFMVKNSTKLGFLEGYSLAWTQKIYDDSKTVELFIFFRRPGSGN